MAVAARLAGGVIDVAHIRFVSTMGHAPWGGSEELWVGAALRLLAAGHRVTAHVYAWQPDPPRIAELERRGAKVVRRRRQPQLPLWRKGLLWALGRPAAGRPFSRLDREATDLVVVSQGQTLDGVSVMRECLRRGWPYAPVVQANGDLFWPGDQEAPEIGECYARSRQNFFVSSNNWRLLCDQLGREIGCDRVSNPFTVPFDPAVAPRAPDGTLRLACVARVDPVAKGQDVLLAVLARERWRARPVSVSFYGGGRCEALVQAMAARLKLASVSFAGHVDDVAGIWRGHDALVLPSRMEGTPLALIEAMLCARTAIVTDVGGNAELVEDGVSGFVAKAAEADALDTAMERAWERRGEMVALGAAARRRVVAVVPRDPVGDFADRLVRLATAGRGRREAPASDREAA